MADDEGVQNDLTAGAEGPFITPLRNALMPDAGWTYGNQLPIKMLKDPTTGQIVDQDFGVPTGLRDFGNGILDLLQGTKTGQVTPAATQALASVALGRGVAAGPVADDATAGIFAGRGASAESLPGGEGGAQAGLMRFLQAQRIENMGAGDPWGGTGWFKGVDGKWKFEIPDQEAQLKLPDRAPADMTRWDVSDPSPSVSINGPTKLGDILQHDKLFDAYPELKSTTVKPLSDKMVDQGILGVAHEDGSISLAPGHPDDVKSTLLHEIQHQIQNKEGFAVGGSPMEFLPAGHVEAEQGAITRLGDLHNRIKQISDPMTGAPINPMDLQSAVMSSKSGGHVSPNEQATLNTVMQNGLLSPYIKAMDYYKMLRGMSDSAMEKYRSIAGEVEARNVQARLKLEDSSTVHPLDTASRYPAKDQIVRFYTKSTDGSAMAVEPVDGDPFDPAYNMIRDRLKTSGWGTYDPASSNQNAGPAISLRDTQNARVVAGIKSANQKDLVSQGYYPTHALSNGYTVYKNHSAPLGGDMAKYFGDSSHTLVSPNGTPVLYGKSPEDLIARGFPDEDKVSVVPKGLTDPSRLNPGVVARPGISKEWYPAWEDNIKGKVTGSTWNKYTVRQDTTSEKP